MKRPLLTLLLLWVCLATQAFALPELLADRVEELFVVDTGPVCFIGLERLDPGLFFGLPAVFVVLELGNDFRGRLFLDWRTWWGFLPRSTGRQWPRPC